MWLEEKCSQSWLSLLHGGWALLCFRGKESFEVFWVSVQWEANPGGKDWSCECPQASGEQPGFMRIGRYYDKESSLAMRPERQE